MQQQTQVYLGCLGKTEAYSVTVPLDLFNLFFFQLALHLAASLILRQILRYGNNPPYLPQNLIIPASVLATKQQLTTATTFYVWNNRNRP